MSTPEQIAAGKITRAKVRASLAANPVQTLKQVGDEVGITRERVRQIIRDEGLHRAPLERPDNRPTCASCGKRRAWQTYVRPTCNACTPQVRQYLTLTCDECGTQFQREPYQNRSKGFVFCSNVCHGRYAGKHYARGRPKVRTGDIR